ncbi:MAG: hypothetical protein U5L73_07080 [Rhodoferax sp.]|uniref:hypothetical protein n=1 Tax=Rhodoferax sp. TaxID=50421 RepID=UPI002ACE611B|nr:hypothetical protein [Rhodoferax sp.]MDZ7891507.1 hypothetical protein [Rhodoferax sp.]
MNTMIELATRVGRAKMRPLSWRSLRSLKFVLLSGLMLLATAPGAAQTSRCVDVCALYSELLMSPERTLIGSIRSVERVAKPALGPRNTRGRWIQREVYLGSEAFHATFYVGAGLVQRIELVSTAPEDACRNRSSWANVLEVIGVWQDKDGVTGSLEARDTLQQSMHWAIENVDVSVYLSLAAETCSMKVAFRKREVKDAATL